MYFSASCIALNYYDACVLNTFSEQRPSLQRMVNGLSNGASIMKALICALLKNTPYERYAKVIQGMESVKFSLLIPPLAGQGLEPSHLLWVHGSIGG